jgi:4-hydroxy-3-methylbut-2-enyl diphosphate reductase
MSEEIMLDETCVEPEAKEDSKPETQDTEAPVQAQDETPEFEPSQGAAPQGGETDSEPAESSAPENEANETDGPATEPETPAEASTVEENTESEEATAEPEVAAETEETAALSEDSERDEQAAAPETFAEMLEKSIKTLHTGDKVTGIVTSITATEVSVDLGTKQSGYIPIAEFTDDMNTNIDDIIKIGDSIETFVLRVNDVEGMVMLSKRRLDAIKNWDVIEAAKENRAIVEGVVTEDNKGGIVVNVKGVRVFVPASQTGLPKSSPMSELVKKQVKLRITEVNQSRRRVVGSIRAVHAEERREKSDRLWTDIEVGKQYNGIVKSMTSYGVFVDIGGVDGMIHISELSWTRIKQPSEVMSVGDEVSVFVLSFDKDSRKISLGYKKNTDNPWMRFTTQNAVGDVIKVKIVKMMPFGAFAEILPGVDGLIHISQITDHRIGLPSEVLSDGQLVDVKITEIDNDRKKVSLSIRALIEPASQPVTDSEAAEAAASDRTPVIVYDTDAPPEADSDPTEENLGDDEQAGAPETDPEAV